MSVQKTPGLIPRYEFRIFDEHLENLYLKMKTLSSSEDIIERHSEEVYLISEESSKVNCKIRNNTIDIKLLLNVQDRLEQWSPVYKSPFPVAGSEIETEVLKRLGIEKGLTSELYYNCEDFIEQLKQGQALSTVQVKKRRFGIGINNTICEFAKLEIAGKQLQTIAVESESKEKAKETMALLGIDSFENTNYPAAIRKVISAS